MLGPKAMKSGTSTLVPRAMYKLHSSVELDREDKEQRDSKPDCTGESIQVRVTTVDRLVEKHGVPDYLKIDAEGSRVPRSPA